MLLTPHTRLAEYIDSPAQHELLKQDAAATFFDKWYIRPSPQHMASFIARGLTESDIEEAGNSRGYTRPKMDALLADVATSLPYFDKIVDRIVDQQEDGQTTLHAGRDAEVLADIQAIVYPDTDSRLFPASTHLWWSGGMKRAALAKRFFAGFDLTPEAVADPRKKYKLVDSGFFGSIGMYASRQFEMLYGIKLLDAGKLAVGLVCTRNEEALGEQILDFPGGREAFGESVLPRAHAWVEPRLARRYSDTWYLAVGMQTMPRYHEGYSNLQELDGEVVAVAFLDDITPNLDDPQGRSFNASLVNPLAAAIVQHHVVSAALERRAKQAWVSITN